MRHTWHRLLGVTERLVGLGLSGSTTKFLRADGSEATPTAGAGLAYMYPFADAIDDPINDNFREGDGAGGMDTSGNRGNPSTPTAWTARNHLAGFAASVADGRAWLTSPARADAPNLQLEGYDQPVPSGNWCIRMAVMIRPT